MSEARDILFETRGLAGVITLNRPRALNALTPPMVRAMHEQLAAWAADERVHHVVVTAAGERAFCAGGDIRRMYEAGRAGDPEWMAFYADEYRLNHFVRRYPKPYVSLIDGIVMGGGVGITVHGSHRIASERITFAMPEVGIGFFPDVGGTYFLPRLPRQSGAYLALTGSRIGIADCLWTGVATHAVPSARLSALLETLCEREDVDAAVSEHAVAREGFGCGVLEAHIDMIERCFAAETVEAVLLALAGEKDEWANEVAETIRFRSPTSLRIALRQVREGAGLDFAAAMRLEYRIVRRIMQGSDFYEGVRAAIIDKDNDPHWRPATLAEVSESAIDAHFAPLPEGDLDLD